MWIWWIVSLIILIACVIFAYRMIVSSYEFLPADKRFFFGFHKNSASPANFPEQGDALKILRNKVQHVEDNTTFYNIQFSKFQDRLKVIEEKFAMSSQKTSMPSQNDVAFEEEEEDWKEMYYEENSKKESLENKLDFANQALEEAENKLKEFEEDADRFTRLQSEYELQLSGLKSMQNNIIDLQKQLDASLGREKELEQLLLSEITMREKYSLLQQKYTQLLSETDDLRRRNAETHKNDDAYHKLRKYQRQLESKLSICENEKKKLKEDYDQLLIRHKNG